MGEVHSVAFSPDGKLLVSGSEDGKVRLWNVDAQKVQSTLDSHKGAVYGVAFSPDGKQLASAGADGTARLWDAATGKPVLTLGEASGAAPTELSTPSLNTPNPAIPATPNANQTTSVTVKSGHWEGPNVSFDVTGDATIINFSLDAPFGSSSPLCPIKVDKIFIKGDGSILVNANIDTPIGSYTNTIIGQFDPTGTKVTGSANIQVCLYSAGQIEAHPSGYKNDWGAALKN